MTDEYIDHVSRAAVMLCIVVLAVMAGYLGFAIGFMVAGLIK